HTYIISIDGSKFDLYYLYCLSIFQRTLLFKFCFVSKAGAKVRGLFKTAKCFGKFFFNARLLFPSLSVRKGKKRQPKALALRIGLQR
ncbi:hypothetical protein K0G63_21820, partial [Bacteroides fragilis]|nr:hypothetical protein [Bacteroides fragilis]